LLSAVPGVVFGALVPDWRVLRVPAIAVGGGLLVSFFSDPACDSCGFTASWTVITVAALVVFVLAAMTIGMGVTARRTVDRWVKDRASRA
jgi:hypothetical protein